MTSFLNLDRPEFCSPMLRPFSLPAIAAPPPLDLAEPEPFTFPSDRTLTRWKKMVNLEVKMEAFEQKEDLLYSDGNEMVAFSDFAEHAALVTCLYELSVEEFYFGEKIPSYTECRDYVSDLNLLIGLPNSSGRTSPTDDIDLLCRKRQQQAFVKAQAALRALPLMNCDACRMDQAWCSRKCKMRTFIGLDDIYKSVLATGVDVRKVE